MYYSEWAAIHIFHFQPFWPRLILLFFFCLNLILGLWFLVLITKERFFSFLAVALFAVFYRNTPIIFVFCEGNLYSVYTFFFLLGLICYYYFLNNKKIYLYILSILLYILALLTMEASVVYPVVLFLLEIFFNNVFKLRVALKRMIPFAIVFVGYAAITLFSVKQTGSFSIWKFQRGGHHLAHLSDIVVRISHWFMAHFPSSRFYDIGMLPFDKPRNLIFFVLGPLVIFTLIVLFLKVPSYLKFILLTLWVLALPFALFEIDFGLCDRYLYFSGLFFNALVIMTLKLFINKKYLITYIIFIVIVLLFFEQNIILFNKKVAQWKEADHLVKNVGYQLTSQYPTLPPSPIFIIGIPYSAINAGHPGNFIYFLYGQTWPDYLSFHDTVYQAAYKYSWMKKCWADADFINNPPQALVYQQERFEKIDLLKVSQDLNLSSINFNCDQEPNDD
jgi:hypothetical protein